MSAALPKNVVEPHTNAAPDEPAFDLDAIIKLFGPKLTNRALEKEASKTKPNTGLVDKASPILDPSAVRDHSANTNPPSTAKKTALVMALCGWTGQDLTGVQIASCPKCFTRVGLWLYSPNSDSGLDEEEMGFDAVMLHRAHCPWQNPRSQSGLGSYSGLSGWQILADMLQIEIRRAERQNAPAIDDYEHSEAEEITASPKLTRDEVDLEDKAREGRLERLKRAFMVKSTLKKGQRPASSKSIASFRSSRSVFSKGDQP